MTEGTTTRSAAEIDAAVEALGASLVERCRLGRIVARHHRADRRGRCRAGDRRRRRPQCRVSPKRSWSASAPSPSTRFTVAMSDPGEVAGMAAMRALYGAVGLWPSRRRHRHLAACDRPCRHRDRLSRRLGARQCDPDPVRRYRSGTGAGAGRAPFRQLDRSNRDRATRADGAQRRAQRDHRHRHAGFGPGGGRGRAQQLARRDPHYLSRDRRQCGARRRLQRAAQPGNPHPPRPLLWLGQQHRARRATGPVHRRRRRPATMPPPRCSA